MNLRLLFTLSLVFAMGWNSSGSFAQSVASANTAVPAEELAEFKPDQAQKTSFDPSQASLRSSPSTQISLTGTKDDAIAKAMVGLQVGNFTADVKGSVPIAKSKDDANIADLDGLAKKASADFGLSWARWRPKATRAAMEEVCARKLMDEKSVSQAAATALLRQQDADGNFIYPCSLLAMRKGSIYRERFVDLVDWGHPLLFTVRYKFAQEQFQFTDPTTFQDQKASHVSQSGSVGAGILTTQAGSVLFGYQHQSVYKGQDSKNICSPISTTTSLACRDTSLGAPDHANKDVAQLEYKQFIGSRFGIAPLVSGDFHSKTAAIRVPLYFFRSTESGLNGGLALGWRSDASFTATVFVGDVLTLFSK